MRRHLRCGFLVALLALLAVPGCSGDAGSPTQDAVTTEGAASDGVSADTALARDGDPGDHTDPPDQGTTDTGSNAEGGTLDSSPSSEAGTDTDLGDLGDLGEPDAAAITEGGGPDAAPTEDTLDGALGMETSADGATGMEASTDGTPGMEASTDGAPADDGGGSTPATEPPRSRVVVATPRIPRGDGFATVVTLDASGSTGGGLRYQWSIPDGRLEPGSDLTSPVVRVRLPGTADHG
jgi:hypothetical protein